MLFSACLQTYIQDLKNSIAWDFKKQERIERDYIYIYIYSSLPFISFLFFKNNLATSLRVLCSYLYLCLNVCILLYVFIYIYIFKVIFHLPLCLNRSLTWFSGELIFCFLIHFIMLSCYSCILYIFNQVTPMINIV